MAMNEKPKCPLIRANGNIYNLLGMASRTLRENDMREQAILNRFGFSVSHYTL